LARTSPGKRGYEERTFQCSTCQRVEKLSFPVDPLKTDAVGWLAGELKPRSNERRNQIAPYSYFIRQMVGAQGLPEKAGTMCVQCDDINKRIEHYRRLASRLTDQPMLDGIQQLIERMQARKAALHPEHGK
jgi:hypothetical protein